MITSILHQIWNQRRSNGWLFAELLIVFILMWYCVDVLYGFLYAAHQPKGYDMQHVYKVTIAKNPTQEGVWYDSKDSLQEYWFKPLDEVIRRIRQHPAVEGVTFSLGSDAYTRSTMFQGYTVDSAKVQIANIRYVSPEYFDVMRIPFIYKGNMEWNHTASPLPAVVSEDLADSLFHTTENVIGREFMDYYDAGRRYRVAAVCARQKTDDYARYTPFILTPLPWWYFTYQIPPHLSVRIRPEADTDDFATRFFREMTPQLQLAPIYLFSVESYEEQKRRQDADSGATTYVRSAMLVVVFFVFNVFMGLMGTFWFRTRHRRSEIALRMAMGSSRAKIRTQFIGEALLILTLAALPAIYICAHIVWADATFTAATDASWPRFATTTAAVYLLMALMVVAGIWFPARSAMQVQPAEALCDE